LQPGTGHQGRPKPPPPAPLSVVQPVTTLYSAVCEIFLLLNCVLGAVYTVQ